LKGGLKVHVKAADFGKAAYFDAIDTFFPQPRQQFFWIFTSQGASN
jgi:hypothetical protein